MQRGIRRRGGDYTAVNEGALSKRGIPRGMAPVVSRPEHPLSDDLLIVEDLLLQARTLADLGAPIETVKAILDHVVAVREGRG